MSEVLLLHNGMRVHADGCDIGTTMSSRAIAGHIPCPTREHHDGRDPATDLTGARRITVDTTPKRPSPRRTAPAPRRDAPGRAAALVGNRPTAPARRAAAPLNRAEPQWRPATADEKARRDAKARQVADEIGLRLGEALGGAR